MSTEYRPSYRDLTKRFITLRESYRPVGIPMPTDNQKATLLPTSGSDSLSQDSQPDIHASLPPVWVETLEAIDYDLQKIEQQISLLQTYHAKRLRISFDENKQQDTQIQETTRSITELFREAQFKLKRVATMGNEENQKALPYQERIIRVNVMRSRGMKVQELTKTFRHAQREFLEKLSKQESRGGRLINEDINATLPSFDRLEQGFTRQQMQQLEDMEVQASQRTREIIAIAKSVNELAQLFNELSVLVVEQGSLLDRIDYNVEQTLDNLKGAQEQVQQAEKHQKASRSILCIIVLILLVFVGAIVLIIRNLPSS